MFSATYLGQQGWLIAGARGRILVDPLLTDEYSPGFAATIYPPRAIEPRRFPPIDAVVLSHEHADHLSVPSLALLDRRIPVILPARAASAAREAIERLGFRVVPADPGAAFTVGALEIRLYGGELARDAELETEWTTLQISVADRGGDGSFFTYVDSWPAADTLAQLARTGERLGLLCHVNNTMDWSCLEGGLTPGWPRSALDYAAEIIAAEAAWWRDRPAPALTAVCGPGLAFTGADAWLNQILCADSQRVCDALAALAPERAFRAPLPGETFSFERGRLRRTARRAPFMRVLDRKRWPALRVRERRALIEEYPPVSGQETLDEGAWPELERGLEGLAAYLYRRGLSRTLHALAGRALGRRRPAFALVLRVAGDRVGDERAYVLEYDPGAGRFRPVDCRAPTETYVAGLECWAADLWRVLDGQLLPQRLLGHLRTWSYSPIPLSPLQAVWGFFDLANRPAAAAAFYGPLVERARAQAAVIAAGPDARALREGQGRGRGRGRRRT